MGTPFISAGCVRWGRYRRFFQLLRLIPRIAVLVNRCFGHRLVDQHSFADTVGSGAEYFLSGRTIHRNLCVGNDDAVTIGDFLCSQHVFRSAEPRVSTFTKHPFAFAAFSTPRLPCKCVGNTGRAGSNGENLHLIFFASTGSARRSSTLFSLHRRGR